MSRDVGLWHLADMPEVVDAQQILQTTYGTFLTVPGALFGLPLSTRPHAKPRLQGWGFCLE